LDDLLLPVIGSIVVIWHIVIGKVNLHVNFRLLDGFKLMQNAPNSEEKEKRQCSDSPPTPIDCSLHHKGEYAGKIKMSIHTASRHWDYSTLVNCDNNCMGSGQPHWSLKRLNTWMSVITASAAEGLGI
jgi:hypothetical protein